MLQGETAQEAVQLNIESLWSGGPFQDPVRLPTARRSARRDAVACGTDGFYSSQTYNGGNKLPSDQQTDAEQIQLIRQSIFESPNGTIDSQWSCGSYHHTSDY